MKDITNLLEGLKLIEDHDPKAKIVIRHKHIYAGEDNAVDKYSAKARKSLLALGWKIDKQYQAWIFEEAEENHSDKGHL